MRLPGNPLAVRSPCASSWWGRGEVSCAVMLCSEVLCHSWRGFGSMSAEYVELADFSVGFGSHRHPSAVLGGFTAADPVDPAQVQLRWWAAVTGSSTACEPTGRCNVSVCWLAEWCAGLGQF